MTRSRLLATAWILVLLLGCSPQKPPAPGGNEPQAKASAAAADAPGDEDAPAEQQGDTPASAAGAADRSLADWIGLLGDETKRLDALEHLVSVRDERYEDLLDPWKEAGGAVRKGLEEVLQIDLLREADMVVRGRGMEYQPRSHLGGISGECLVCAKGRLPISVAEVWKGESLFREGQGTFGILRRLPGHAAHELPKIMEGLDSMGLIYVEAKPDGEGLEALKVLDETHKRREGVWILRFPEHPVTVGDMRSGGTIKPEFLLTWIAEAVFVPDEGADRIAATLQAIAD